MTDTTTTGLDLTQCPECGQVAQIEDRMVLSSTSGPVEHARVRCVQRHWFHMPTAALGSAPRAPRGASDHRVPST